MYKIVHITQNMCNKKKNENFISHVFCIIFKCGLRHFHFVFQPLNWDTMLFECFGAVFEFF